MISVEDYIKEHNFVVFITCGFPGSGKTTLCKKLDIPCICRDNIRQRLRVFPYADGNDRIKISKRESDVTKEMYHQIMNYYFEKQSFSIDDTSGTIWRKDLLRLLKSLGAYIVGINLDTPYELCCERRKGFISKMTMEDFKQHHIFLTEDDVDELISIKGY